MRLQDRRRCHGVTLVEILIVVLISGILAAVAVPALSSIQHNTRLRGTADVLVSELRLAQSEALKRQCSVSLNFRESPAGWCYGYSIDATCDCREALSCAMDGVESVRHHDQHPGVQLNPGVSGNRFSFQPQRGTVNAGNVTLTGGNGNQLRVVVSGFGRIRLCTPAGPGQYSGYPVC